MLILHFASQFYPPLEGQFLDFACSVAPSKREKLKTLAQPFAKFPPLPGAPSPQGMADDIIFKISIFYT